MSLETLYGWQGGLMIGAAASLLWILNGRIFGVSGILGGALRPDRKDLAWRLAVLMGLGLGGLMARAVMPEAFDASPSRSTALLALAGLLVGFGTRLGSGCTSGHGICGVSRLSPRSLVATAVFLTTGMTTATVMHYVGGGL